MFRPNKQQREAIEKAVAWYYDTSYNKKNYFIITGYAGTGKSSTVNTLIQILGLPSYSVLFAAYTGKAALILRMKGNVANTIHRTFYNIFKLNGQYFFRVKNSLPSMIKLIVIDEFSMINDKMINDILSFGLPVIFLGDEGQLPPIIGNNTFISNKENIDARLTEVMRQDSASGVLELATMARNGEIIKPGIYKNSRVLYLKDVESNIEDYDIILCWRNSTRKLFNQAVRKKLGYNTTYPVKGEKIIGLKNNYYHQIDYEGIPIFPANGLPSTTLDDFVKSKDDRFIRLKYRPDFINDDDGPFFDSLCHCDYFDQYERDIEKETVVFEQDGEDDIVHLDFGYCLSTFRAQGSEYKHGLFLDEFKGPQEVYNKFVYTGLTRFSMGVDFVKDFER